MNGKEHTQNINLHKLKVQLFYLSIYKNIHLKFFSYTFEINLNSNIYFLQGESGYESISRKKNIGAAMQNQLVWKYAESNTYWLKWLHNSLKLLCPHWHLSLQ